MDPRRALPRLTLLNSETVLKQSVRSRRSLESVHSEPLTSVKSTWGMPQLKSMAGVPRTLASKRRGDPSASGFCHIHRGGLSCSGLGFNIDKAILRGLAWARVHRRARGLLNCFVFIISNVKG
eukprot:Colp12_sorted_trinity150504_noHs@22616